VMDVWGHRGVVPLTHPDTTPPWRDNTTPEPICARSLEVIAQNGHC
jgi:hypothetical protein